ncbi:MAG TPA: ester cyclase [Thermomicrobiales bacterium]
MRHRRHRRPPSAVPPGTGGVEITTDLVLVDGDYVTVRWTLRGTHLGEFRGVPPSGAEVTYTGISIFRIECGRIVETWDEADLYGLLQQIGGLPATGEPAATPTA